MPKEIWDNVQKVRIAFKPNQTTEHPILASPSNSVDVYSNILPNQSIAQGQQNQTTQPAQLLPLQQSLVSSPLITPQGGLVSAFPANPYLGNPAGLFHPGMFNNPSPSPTTTNSNINPLFYNNQYPANYLNVMAAAQSILNNAAAYYNSMLVPTTAAQQQQQRILSPQPAATAQQQLLLSPHLQPQTQQQQISPYHSPQITHNQIKRKPVQLQPQPQQRPPTSLSPQIEQRLQRKKSGRSNNDIYVDQRSQHYPGQYYQQQHHPALGRTLSQQLAQKKQQLAYQNRASLDMEQLQRQLQQHHITEQTATGVRKRVRFDDQPTTHIYEREESEDEADNYDSAVEEGEEEFEDYNDNQDNYYYPEEEEQGIEDEEVNEYPYTHYSDSYDYRQYPEDATSIPGHERQRITTGYQARPNYQNTPSYNRADDRVAATTTASYRARDANYSVQPLFHNQTHGRNSFAKTIDKNAPFWRRKNA